MEIRRRLPAVHRCVSEIDPEKDVRVRILGTVIDIRNNVVVLDDGTGKAEIIFEDQNDIGEIKGGEMLRIITRVLPLMGSFECRGECIQKLDTFDLSLFKSSLGIFNSK